MVKIIGVYTHALFYFYFYLNDWIFLSSWNFILNYLELFPSSLNHLSRRSVESRSRSVELNLCRNFGFRRGSWLRFGEGGRRKAFRSVCGCVAALVDGGEGGGRRGRVGARLRRRAHHRNLKIQLLKRGAERKF